MATSANIQVSGNVEGSIVVGDHNFVVNTNHGTIVYREAAPQVRLRQFAPRPPRAIRGFVNRKEEQAKLESWIGAKEIVQLYAPDGMGKTSLLKQVANSTTAMAMPNGVILLESVDVNGQVLGPTDILQRLFDALFESNPSLKVDAASARTYLSNTGPLVLLDEVSLSETLLRALPDLFPQGAILISTDQPLRGDYQRLAVGPLPRQEAISLLVNKAGIQETDENRETLDSLCGRLGDVSLALIICANVMRELNITPDAVLQAFPQVSENERKAGEELEQIFAFAFSKLHPQEQKILSTAALTPGISMAPEWLDMALDGEPSAPYLERLKSMGLLFENSPRLRLPPGLQLAARRLARTDEESVLSRLADYLIANAETNPQDWDFFQEELGNLSGTLAWAIRSSHWETATRLARALDPYLSLKGLWEAWRETLDSVLSAAQQTGDRATEGWALHQLGTREIGVGTRAQALDFLRRALDIRRELGDITGVAYTQHNIDFLVGPPSPPRGNGPRPQSPRPAGGISLLLLIAGIGGVGLIGLGLLAIMLRPFFSPPPTVVPTPFVPTTLATFTAIPDTVTSIPSTATMIATETPTVTPVPTPIGGGSGRIAFVSDAAGNADIYLMDINDPKPTPLTDSLADDDNPAWATNGIQIAFDSNPDGRAIFIMNIYESSPPHSITRFSENSYPAWSPDRQKIAFVSVQEGNADIYIVDANGEGTPIQLTNDRAWDADPTWSPDSKQIAFVSNRQGGDGFQIYTMNADGSNQTPLPNNLPLGTWNSFPNWSHDGSKIVFQSRPKSDAPAQIYAMSLDQVEKPVQLTFEGDNEFAEWSPDNKLIAFTSNRDGNNEVYMMNADGSNQVNLTHSPANESNPAWQPGGGN